MSAFAALATIRSAVPRLLAALVCGASVLASPLPALAHPHIWIDAAARVIFDDRGRPVAIRHQWAFDQGYSAWAIQGLDTDDDGTTTTEELQPLANDNMRGLAEYDFFTFGSVGETELTFTGPADAFMEFDGTALTLVFELAISPAVPLEEELELEVGDPEYYAAFTFAGTDGVALAGAPAGCSVEVNEPRPIDPALEERLFALPAEVTELPADLRQAARDLANSVVVVCGRRAAPETAAQAASEVAEARPRGTPFTAPPGDPGIRPGTPGILGWIAERQGEFYRALTDALGGLRSGDRAFWVLGTLSFLYGIFHAAGPGHGKVIITSYMVARERDVLRGVGLSFAAAMMQSVTAVAFVLVAAGALRLTSLAMSDAAGWMATGSYALIAVLGAWLVWRKVGAMAGGGERDHGHHDHDHDGHRHAVGPVAGHSLKEMAGIVFAVGLRPCSGALIVLAFSLTQGLLAAGIVATFVMGLGTALTVSVLAAAAVLFKDWAMAAARRGSGWAGRAVGWAELAGAAAVLGFGATLLAASLTG